MRTNTIIKGDCIEIMRKMPDNSVDVIFADPPYNMQLGSNLFRPDATHVAAVTDEWDKFDSFDAYDNFSLNWLKEAKRILKENGTIWVIGSYHNIFRVGYHLQNLKFWILNDIIWVKTNPMPNFKGTRFANAHETLLWCAKSEKAKYTFNYESMKAFNDDIQMRSDWLLPICNGPERLKNAAGKKVHTTQKPECLLYRILLASTNPGDIVLDPFFGTGTTGAVAKKLGRRYIGIEKDETYIKYAKKRLTAIRPSTEENIFDPIQPKKAEPKIPFGSLLEHNLIKPGQKIFDAKQKFSAIIRADGSIHSGNHHGSIHQVAAAVQGIISCNGWTFWHIATKKQKNKKPVLVSLDQYREKLKQEIFNL